MWLFLHALALLGLDALAPPWRLLDEATSARLALLVVAMAVVLDAWALAIFIRARTTVNPLRPELASRLVTQGPYRLSRNPMYLGLALWLLALGTWKATPWVLPVLAVFVVVITRWQILPEERVLAGRFGREWQDWSARVRRWI